MEKDPNKNKTDLKAQEAIEKLQDLVDHESICMFCTVLQNQPVKTRPMGTQLVDDEGNLWFMSSLKSHKNAEIAINNTVQLFYSNPGSAEFLSVFGTATISTDRNKIEELWTPIAKAWFTDGKDDQDISLIKVTPLTAYYWDTKSSKMVSLIKMVASMFTGSAPDDGVEGTLKV